MKLTFTKEIKVLAKHSAVYSIGTFLQRVIGLLLLPIYTRFLTPHDYGVKELVGLSTDVIGILIATSIAGAFYRFYFNYEDPEDKNEVISTALISIGILGLLCVGGLICLSKNFATIVLDDSKLYYFFIISFTALWFQSLNSIGFDYLKANKRSVYFIGISFAKLTMAIILNIYFICFLKVGVVGILISNLIVAIVISIFLTLPLLIKVGFRFSKTKIVEMVRFGLPLLPSQFGAFIVHLSDRFFIKEYVSIADAGIYSLGYRFGALPGAFISDPFNQIFQPRRLEVYKQENSEYVFGRIFTYFVMVILFAGLFVAILTKDILFIMATQKFWDAYKIVPIIVLANTIFTFHYHLNFGIIISKKTKYLAYVNFSNGILVLLLNFILIPRYGIWGAAWATVVAFVYKNSLTYYFSSKFYKLHFEVGRILKLIFISCAVYFSVQAIPIDSFVLALVTKFFLILTAYPIGLICIKFFNEEEKLKIKFLLKERISVKFYAR